MSKDIDNVRESFRFNGSLVIHLIHSKSGLRTVARATHTDGPILGKANGGGYDKAGSALGDAIAALFQPELHKAVADLPEVVLADTLAAALHIDGNDHVLVDGDRGLETVIKIVQSLGYRVRKFDTGKLSDMVLIERK